LEVLLRKFKLSENGSYRVVIEFVEAEGAGQRYEQQKAYRNEGNDIEPTWSHGDDFTIRV
jgi:hypothetical protein